MANSQLMYAMLWIVEDLRKAHGPSIKKEARLLILPLW
jgi:hypothetical protein